MLLLASDSLTVDGVTVFPDHADPNQFWYLPAPVGLATLPGSREPQFTLIEYAPDVASSGVKGVGFLNVTLCLKVSDATQSKILGRIQDAFPNADNPRVAPVPFDDGTVQVVTLDMQGSGGATNQAPAGSIQMVEHILGAVTPDFFGDNNAVFALTLSEDGVTILKAAFEDGMAPVGGIYTLKFTGVRPALDVKVTADLKRVYNSFSVALTGKYYWLQAGIDATFEQLRQDGAIKIEVVNLTGDSSAEDKEKAALDYFKQDILANWFTPSLSPTTAAQADAGTHGLPLGNNTTTTSTTTTTNGSSNAGAHPPPAIGGMKPGATPTAGMQAGGMQQHAPASGAVPGAGAQANQTPTNAGGSATGGATTATPTAAGASPPSGGATPTPTAAGGSPASAAATPTAPAAAGAAQAATPSQSAPNSTTTTTTQSPGGGGSDVASAAGKIADALGSSASQAAPVGVTLQLKFVHQDEQKVVTYEYNRMDAVQRTHAPQGYFGLLLNAIDKSKHFLQVNGTDAFFRQFSVVLTPTRDFAGIGLQTAHVALDYGDPGEDGAKHGEYVFDAANSAQVTWDVFQGQVHRTDYAYTATYAFDPNSGWVGASDSYTLPAVTTENRQLTLDPHDFLGFMTVSVAPGRIDANAVDRVEVFLTYADDKGWTTQAQYVVRAGAAPQTWKLRLSDKTQRTFSYTTRCVLKDGTVFTSDPVTSTASAIFVNDAFAGGIDVVIQPAFDAARTKSALIELNYADDANNYRFSTTEFLQPAPGASPQPTRLRIPIVDAAKRQFTYRITIISAGNQQLQGQSVTTGEPVIIVGDTV